MMRLHTQAVTAMLALCLAMAGCGGGDTATEGAERTTGGESPGVAMGSGSDGAPTSGVGGDTVGEGASNPWGATQAEQCQRPARPVMSSRARKDFDRGVEAAHNGDAKRAQGSFEDALKRDPGAYAALYNLGVLADRAGDERKARSDYQKSLAVLSDYEPAARGIATIELRRNNPQGAIAVVEPIASAHRTNLEIQALYAEVLVEARRYEEAWMAARRALKCDERFVPALIALEKASRAQGRDELADSILAQALEIDPDVAELHFLRGEQLRDEPGRLRDALQSYARAVQLRPDYAEARMALGVLLLAGGNYPEFSGGILGFFDSVGEFDSLKDFVQSGSTIK